MVEALPRGVLHKPVR